MAKVLVSHAADIDIRNKVGVIMISIREPVCDDYVQHSLCVLEWVQCRGVLT